MKIPYIIFMVFCVVLSLGLSFSWWIFANPGDAATEFLGTLRDGNVREAVAMMDDNTCKCPPKGGFISYLKYESGLNPNLNFLMGTSFQIGSPVVKPRPDKTPYVVPWDRPESSDVTVPLTMRRHAPMLLPIPMAFGESMTQKELAEYAHNYEKESQKGLTLRLRPSVAPGLVHKQPLDENEAALPDDVKRYLKPDDAGPVTTEDGNKLDTETIESYLPTLKSVDITMSVVRRGQLKPWTVSKFKFTNPQFESPSTH
jgi:hypothetical protein